MSKISRSLAVALVIASAALIADVAPSMARGAAGAAGGSAGGASGGGGGGSGGGGGEFHALNRDGHPHYFPHYVAVRRSANSCWKATTIFDAAGDALGTIPRQDCYE